MKNIPINYIEFKCKDIDKTKVFYTQCFGWTFMDYGPSYTSFDESGVAGGFEKSDEPITNGALIVLHHQDLESIKQKVIHAGGIISIDIFSFPGGSRFHFLDPSGNELSVWRNDES